MPYFKIPTYYPPPPPKIPTVQPGAVSTGTFSGTYGTYTSSSSNGPGPGCEDWGKKSFVTALSASVKGPLDGTTNVATMASYAVPVNPSFINNATKQAVALAVGSPLQSDVTVALPLNSQLASVLGAKGFPSNCYNFMLGELGAAYNVAGVRTETVDLQLTMTVRVPSPAPAGDLYFGLYNIPATGSFQKLTLRVTKNAADVVFDQTFYSFASFKTALENKAFLIQNLTADTPLPVKIAVTEVLGKGQGANFQIMVADPPAMPAVAAASLNKAQGALNSTGVNSDNLLAPSGKRMLIESDFVPALAISGCVILVGIMMTSGLWRIRKPRDL